MWIMVSGPYSAGGADAIMRAENLRVMNEAAVALFRAGYIPVIGVNIALPMIEAAGGSEAVSQFVLGQTLESSKRNSRV